MPESDTLTPAEEANFTALVERQSRFAYRVAYAILLNAHDAEDTNFDIREVKEQGHQLALHVKADISSNGGNASLGGGSNFQEPIIRHNQWESPILIPVGKPTVIFSSDALESKNAMQVVATVTPIQ